MLAAAFRDGASAPFFMSGPIWRTSRFAIDLARPRVMGIVNVTPDSFSDGGAALTPAQAIAHCEQLLAGRRRHPRHRRRVEPAGRAAGERRGRARARACRCSRRRSASAARSRSTRPRPRSCAPRSTSASTSSTTSPRCARRARSSVVAAHPRCGVCLMHMRGTPRSMQAEARYDDVVARGRRRSCASGSTRPRRRGSRRERIVVDPGHRLRQDAGAEPRAAGAPGRAARRSACRSSSAGRASRRWRASPGWRRRRRRADRRPSRRGSRRRASSPRSSRSQRGARIVRVHDVAATVAGLAVWQAAARRR